jgi:Uma2 family endonuclease
MSPSPQKEHQRLSKRIVAILDQALTEADCSQCEALQEVDWRVSSDTVYRPDVSVVCSDPGADYILRPPQLICEILSESTREKDLHFKRSVYENLGVRYYLIVDPDNSGLVLLELIDGNYHEISGDESRELILSDDCRIRPRLESIFSAR